MLTTQKQRRSYIIRNNFVRITFHEGVLMIEQSNLSSAQSDIFYVQMEEVPSCQAHLFNSVRHVYKYLTGKPECIIQMTQQQLKFVVDVNANTHICCLSLQRLKLTEDAFWLRKKTYEISIKLQEFTLVHNQMQKDCTILRKKTEQTIQTAKMQNEKLQQANAQQRRLLQDLQRHKKENGYLLELLREKKQILKEIKLKQGAFVSLDD